MKNRRNRPACLVLAAVLAIAALAVCGIAMSNVFGWRIDFFRRGQPVQTTPYLETFNAAGTWMAGEGANAAGIIKDGVYEMSLNQDTFDEQFWSSGGLNFADAVIEVEATPIEGTTDNGYGMLFRADPDKGDFYIFKISSDGYVFIGLCQENCSQKQALVDRDWFESQAVNQGFETTNTLGVVAQGSDLSFFVNEILVGEVTDPSLQSGDLGLFGETFAPGGLRVVFDNLEVRPLAEK